MSHAVDETRDIALPIKDCKRNECYKFNCVRRKILTSHKHDKYRETFLHIGVGCHISESHAGQRRACEVQCCYVSRPEIHSSM